MVYFTADIIAYCIGSRKSNHFYILMFSAFSGHDEDSSLCKKGYGANCSLYAYGFFVSAKECPFAASTSFATTASLLLANGELLKQIQDLLGHSDFSTTTNIYAHLKFEALFGAGDGGRNATSRSGRFWQHMGNCNAKIWGHKA